MSLLHRGFARLKMGAVDIAGGLVESGSNLWDSVQREEQKLRQENTRKE